MVRRRHGLGTHLWKGFAETWHVNPRLNRDIWADDASHAVDFLHWLLGVPESVTAEIASLLDPRIPMDNGVAVFRYPNGPIAEVCCSFTCVAGENTTEVFAERGTIVQNYGDAPSSAPARPPAPSASSGSWSGAPAGSTAASRARQGRASGSRGSPARSRSSSMADGPPWPRPKRVGRRCA